MTDEVRALADLQLSVDALVGRFDTLTKEVRSQRAWTRNRFLGVGAGFLLLIAALVLGSVGLTYSVKEARCNRAYNNASAQRSAVLSPATLDLNIRMGKLVETIRPPAGTSPADSQAAFNSALTAYFSSFDKYVADYGSNPLPIAPKYAC